MFERAQRAAADARKVGKTDLTGCKGCKGKLLPKMPSLLLLETPKTHQQLYDQLAQHYQAAGGTINRLAWQPGKPLWNVPALVEEHHPDVVLRWEEHGGLFVSKEWVKVCEWCYEHKIMPAMLDWGFFAHYKSLYIGYFRPDGKPDILDEWANLPETPDWSKASPELAKWREKWLAEWEQSETLGPVPGTEPGYVLIWVQYSANGSRFPGWTGQTWCQDAAKVIKDAGLVPVFKQPPVPGKMPVPANELSFAHKAKIPLLNHRLIRYARHSVAITTTATNGCVLVGAPVVSCGDQWCKGLGVWHDTDDPAEMCLTPEVNEAARGKWANYWVGRQRPLTKAPGMIRRLRGQWRNRSTAVTPSRRSIYMLGRGLGNMLMAVPAIKALAAATSTRVEVTGSKGHARGFLQLIEGERYVKSATRALAKDAKGALVSGVALNYPAQIAEEKFGEQADKIDTAEVRLMTVHESEQDAQAARNLGFDKPLPTSRIHCDPPPADLPPQYIVLCMECAPKWVQGRKRLWPHWKRFAQLWKGPPLVFVGLQPSPWVHEYGVDRLGAHPLPEVAAVIGGADAFVGIDCGLSHVAGALGVPCFILYGPTTSYHTGPYMGALTALDGKHPCRACFGASGWASCESPKCMSSIHPEQVVDVLTRLLWRRGRPLEAETAREQMRGRWYQALQANRRPAQWPQELEALWPIMAEVQAERVLEIGVKRGGWLYVMSPTLRPRAHVIGVDVHMVTVRRNGFQTAMEADGYRVDLVVGNSHTEQVQAAVRAALDGQCLDILHIDGDHTEASALADWAAYKPLVRSGGLVILHDAFKPNEGVRAAIEKIKVAEGPRIMRWRWIHRMRAGGSAGPGIAIAEVA